MSTNRHAFDLSQRVALVTGAAQGLGKTIAEALANAGASVIVCDLSSEGQSNELVSSLTAQGHTAWNFPADVSSESAVDCLFEQIRRTCGRLDILVNNAGTTRAQDIFETSLADWQRVIDVNLTGCFLCSRRAMAMMKAQGSGRIINLSSMVAHRGALFGHVHYAASKAGILGITKTLARTGAQHGITVNAIAPGIIETELLLNTHGPEKVAELAAGIPLGLGQPEDVALSAVFLASDAARYITGATLDVNGGAYIH